MNWAKKMIRRWHFKEILVGILVMALSVIAVAIILLVVLLLFHRGITIGPLYLSIPILTFTAGFYWCLRRSSQPMVSAKHPSTVAIIAKSTVVGLAAIIISEIAYLSWIWIQIPRNLPGFVSIDVRLLIYYWPVLVGVFLAGFFFEYRRGSKQRSMSTGGHGQMRKSGVQSV